MYANAQSIHPGGNTIHEAMDVAEKPGPPSMRNLFHGACTRISGKLKRLRDARDPFAVVAISRNRLACRIRKQRSVGKQKADRQLEAFLLRHRHWRDPSKR